jgi:drug/metabolite transporter (DMT)-like permease
VYLVFPGLSAPPWPGAILMGSAGAGWGFYSLAAKSARAPLAATASNFSRAVPMAIVLLVAVWAVHAFHFNAAGLGLAMISGAVTSGLGYAIWYMALRNLSPSRAAIVQLTVPVIAALGAVIFLGERLSWRLALAGAAILGGVAVALFGHRAQGSRRP